MKKLFFCILALLLAIQISAFAQSTEIVQKELLPESTTQALSVNDFVTDTEYPYETVGYFLDDVIFMGEDLIEVSITFTGNYGSNEYFFSNCYIPVYDYESGKLLDIFYSEVELERPFATSSRTTIKRYISTKNLTADIYKIKVIMLESLTSLRPNCPVPYLANELVISKNDIGKEIPTVTFKGKISAVPLSDEELYVTVENIYSVKLSDAALAMGYREYDFDFGGIWNFKYNQDLKPYLGLCCDFVVDISDEMDLEIISVTPTKGKNIEVVIDPELLVSTNNGGYAEYYNSNDATKTSKLKLDYDLRVYYNLVWENYNDIVVPGGNLGDIAYRFVDTDYNGMYDTVFVENECVFVVGSVNTRANKIYRDTETNVEPTYRNASLTLDPENEYVSWSIKDMQGNTMELSDIQPGDVIAVKITDDYGYTFYDIIVSNETIEGVVSEVRTDTSKVGGYNLNKCVINDTTYMRLDNESMPVGDSVVAKVYRNKIIDYTVVKAPQNLGIILATNRAENFGVTYQLQILNQDGAVVVYDLAEKVNGQFVDYYSFNYPVGDIIAYELNSKGQIVATDISSNNANNVLDVTDRIIVDDYADYRATSGKLGSNFITEATIIFATSDAKDYVEKGNVILCSADIFEEDINYHYSLISDENKEVKIIILYEVGNLPEEPEVPDEVSPVQYGIILATNRVENFGVTYQLQILNQDGEVVVYNLAEKVNDTYVSDAELYDYSVGDIIAYTLNSEDEIKYTNSYVLEETDRIDSNIADYDVDSQKLDSYHISEDTIIFATSEVKNYINKDNVMVTTSEILQEDVSYEYSVISDENEEAKVVILYEVGNLPEKPEVPEEIYPVQYGVILATNRAENFGVTYQLQILNQDGEVVVYNLAEKVNGTYVSDAEFYEYSVGDIIAYTLNSEYEIKYTNSYVLEETDRIDSSIADYNAVSQKLGSYYITEDTIIFATDVPAFDIDADSVMLTNSDILHEDFEYEFEVIANYQKEAKVLVLYEVSYQVDYNSYPFLITNMSIVNVNGERRTKFYGYLNGEDVEMIVAADADEATYGLSTGDIALFATNTDGEIVKSYVLADRIGYNEYVVAANSYNQIIGRGAADDESDTVLGNAVHLSLNGDISIGNDVELKGFGAAGKAFRIQGNYLRLLDAYDYWDTFEGWGRNYSCYTDEDRINDFYVDSSSVAYLYNAKTGKFEITSIFAAESDYNTGDYANSYQLLDNDDFIYVYNYDGETKLILIIDVDGDN